MNKTNLTRESNFNYLKYENIIASEMIVSSSDKFDIEDLDWIAQQTPFWRDSGGLRVNQ